MGISWQKRRSHFNHDWLKNQYIPKLGTWMNILDDEIEDDDFLQSFVYSILPEWERYKDEALRLTIDFENEMSPKILFNNAPLCFCDESTKEWLGNLVHMMWLERCSVQLLVKEARDCVMATTTAYGDVTKAVSACDAQDLECLRPFRHLFSELLNASRSLSNAFERFPSEVKTL